MIKLLRAVYAASRHADVLLPGLSALMGGGSAPRIAAQKPLPAPEDPQIARTAERERLARQQARGLLATNLTSGDVGDDPATRRTKLLGGGRSMAS